MTPSPIEHTGASTMERIAFRPVRNASGATMLVTSFAVAMILQVLFQNLISARSQPVAIPDLLGQSVTLGGLVIGVNKIVAILTTLVMLIALELFMQRQKHGIAMRAAAEDFAVARLMGVRANTVISAAFALSGLLAGVAAVLWVSQRASVDPLMGWTSSGDTQSQVKLRFESKEAALDYCKEHGIDATVSEPKGRKRNIRPRGYGENFATDRRGAWTH